MRERRTTRLGPGEFERPEVRGTYSAPGSGDSLSDDRTGDWEAHPKDVTAAPHSTIVVERATHKEVADEAGAGAPLAATLRVTVRSPYQPPVTNSFTISFTD